MLREPLVLYENSHRVPQHLLESVFGKLYVVVARVIDPAADLGWPGTRKRIWAVLVLRSVLEHVYASLDNVVDLFARNRCCSWRIFLEHTLDELHSELVTYGEARKTKTTTAAEMDKSVGDLILELGEGSIAVAVEHGIFRWFLSQSEEKHLALYEADPDLSSSACCMLSQNQVHRL
jgi:hypothetical protein